MVEEKLDKLIPREWLNHVKKIQTSPAHIIIIGNDFSVVAKELGGIGEMKKNELMKHVVIMIFPYTQLANVVAKNIQNHVQKMYNGVVKKTSLLKNDAKAKKNDNKIEIINMFSLQYSSRLKLILEKTLRKIK